MCYQECKKTDLELSHISMIYQFGRDRIIRNVTDQRERTVVIYYFNSHATHMPRTRISNSLTRV